MRIVRSVSLSPESIEIAYMDDTSDIRGDLGSVYQVHTVCIRRDDPELDEDAEALETAVSAFLERAIRRWATTPPVPAEEAFAAEMRRFMQPDDDDDDDEEEDR